MGMTIGEAKVTLVQYEHGAMHVECFKNRLQMVLEIMDNGGIAEDNHCYGSPDHKRALAEIQKQLYQVRAKIREQATREREGRNEE